MKTEIERKIRSRIEAILINDARNHAEIKMMAADDDPLENDPFGEERNLYQRIISSYRNAVSEVNSLLEENVGFLSGFYRIVETIKEKDDFQQICAQVVDCVLDDLGADYCSVVFHPEDEKQNTPLYLEGIREQRKFVCSHSHSTLLGNPAFDSAVERLSEETEECLIVDDVYREPRFNNVDFPSVVRSMICLPIRLHQRTVGVLVLSHSMPRFFTQNHARVLKILASTIAHLWLLTSGRRISCPGPAPVSQTPAPSDPVEEALSIALLNFDSKGQGRRLLADREIIQDIRLQLSRTLSGKEAVLLYDETELLVLLPGTAVEDLPERVRRLQASFEQWKNAQGEKARWISLNLGYSTCEPGEDLIRTLEMASVMMRADDEESPVSLAGLDS